MADAEAARLAELDAATATQEGQIFPLKFRQLPGDAISEAEFSDDDSDYELIEPGDLDMFELAGAPAPAAAGAPAPAAAAAAGECSSEKITAKQSESALAKQIFDILKEVSSTQSGVITEQEERHLEAMTDRVGCSNLCDIMAGIGIDHAKIKDIQDKPNRTTLQRLLGELDELRVKNKLSPLSRDSKTRVGIRKGKTCAKRKAKIQDEIEILKNINKKTYTKKKDGIDNRKNAIKQLQKLIDTGKIKPTDAEMNDLNRFVDMFNTYISGLAGGGKRARRVRRTKRTKGKSRGRAGKATRVRRNNNSNSNKTKRNKGKKRRTKRA